MPGRRKRRRRERRTSLAVVHGAQGAADGRARVAWADDVQEVARQPLDPLLAFACNTHRRRGAVSASADDALSRAHLSRGVANNYLAHADATLAMAALVRVAYRDAPGSCAACVRRRLIIIALDNTSALSHGQVMSYCCTCDAAADV